MSISIVIPVFNEIDNLEPLYAAITEALEGTGIDYEVILCNDGSRDGSCDVLDRIAARDPRFKIIHLRRNFGQTAALMAGFQHAAGETIVAMDADLQNDPRDIPTLLEAMVDGVDVVSGWRVNRKEGLIRRLPSRIANWLISRTTGVRLHDYGCTLKAYRADILKDVTLYGEMHRFIPAFAVWRGGDLREVPVRHHPRTHGASKYGLDRTSRVLLDLLVVSFLGFGLDRPIQFFGKVAVFSGLLATVAGVYSLYLKFFEGISLIQTPLPLLVTLLVLAALIFLAMGLIAEMQTRIYFETRSRHPYVIAETRNFVDEEDDHGSDAAAPAIRALR